MHISIPLIEGIAQKSKYTKYFKDIISIKRKWEEHETMILTEECSVIRQTKLLPKLKYPKSFTIPNSCFDRVLCDIGASISLIQFSVIKNLGLGKVKPVTIFLQLADRSIKYLRILIEKVLVKLDRFIFL